MAVKGSAVEVPPPGAGVVTVMFTTPAVAMLEAGIVAVNPVELWYCVAMLIPLTAAVESGANPVPVKKTCVAVSTSPEFGLIDVSAGAGAFAIETVTAFDTAGLAVALFTVMLAVPTDASRLAGTVAVMDSTP